MLGYFFTTFPNDCARKSLQKEKVYYISGSDYGNRIIKLRLIQTLRILKYRKITTKFTFQLITLAILK